MKDRTSYKCKIYITFDYIPRKNEQQLQIEELLENTQIDVQMFEAIPETSGFVRMQILNKKDKVPRAAFRSLENTIKRLLVDLELNVLPGTPIKIEMTCSKKVNTTQDENITIVSSNNTYHLKRFDFHGLIPEIAKLYYKAVD